MKEENSNKTGRGHYLLKVTGIALLAFVMLVNIVGAAPSANITFVSTGSSFSPIITVTGNPTIQWVFGDGSISNSASPDVNFGSAGIRTNSLVVTPWSAVTKINIGYDGSDVGVTPSPDTIASLRQQDVIAVNGLENVAPYLQVWASSYNPITALDFSNFTALQTVECFYCTSLSTITLRNVPSLTRLCLERSNISYLDLSEAPALADLRGARQGSSTYTIIWGTTGANLWHICTRDNPQMTSTFPYSQFPLLIEFLNWNDNQTGTLNLTSTSLDEVQSAGNYYNAAVFSSCFPAGRSGAVEIQNNNLISLDISNDPGLLYLNASYNSLNQTAVDGVLQTLDSYNTYEGSLDLTGNAAPSVTGTAYANNLITRNWEVKISSGDNPPVANFTCNATFGMTPLEVQFNDTSTNNPAKWLWDFGDGAYSTEKFPKHIYYSPGNYTVTLRVSNANGSGFKVVLITVLEQPVLPVANFSSSVTEGYTPLEVQFTDLSKDATSWNWDFGDGTNSTVTNPTHMYSVVGNFTVNQTVGNANGTASKNSIINVLQASGSDGDGSSNGGSSSGGSSGGGGGAGGSPEPQSNVEVKELSQTFIINGQTAKFDFPQKATAVTNISFDSKKTAGKTTTIVEMLKNKSTLVSEPPSDEVYKFLNIWVGNSGYATEKNIENAVVNFKVEKSWIQDKKIDRSTITLNRYNDSKWNQLPTSLLAEDEKYLYFTAKTPGFSPFAVQGKMTRTEYGQPADEQKTLLEYLNGTQTKPNTESTAADAEQKVKQTQNSNISGKENTKTPGFEIGLVIACLLYVCSLKRK